MPYLQFDLATYLPSATKRRLALRVIDLYADVMQTSPAMVNVGFRELGSENLFHLRDGALAPACLVMCDVRQGRDADQRGRLAEALRALLVEELGMVADDVIIEFTQHAADEMHRATGWGRTWSPAEAGGDAGAGGRAAPRGD